MMAPNRVKLEMLGQSIGQRRDATRALTQVPTGWGSFACPASPTVGQNAVNPRGMGTASPYQKRSLPNSKKSSKKTLTKGGESSSACWQAGQGAGRGRGLVRLIFLPLSPRQQGAQPDRGVAQRDRAHDIGQPDPEAAFAHRRVGLPFETGKRGVA